METEFSKKTIEDQLLVRALNSSYISKEILGAGVPILLKDPINVEIGYALVRYYSANTELITENTLNSLLEKKFDLLNHKNLRLNKPILSSDEMDRYFSKVKDLFSLEEDTNQKLEKEIDDYIHDELATAMIAEEVQKGLDNLSQRVSNGMEKINDLSIGSGSVKTFEFFKDTNTKLELYKNFHEDKIPFNVSSLDEVTRGGLERGQVALFAATSGGGKTAFLTNLSYYFSVKSKCNVLHITLEEKESDQSLRLDRIVLNSGIEDTFDLDGKIKPSFSSKVKNIYPRVNPKSHGILRIVKSTPDTLTIDSLYQLIRNCMRKDNVSYDVIVLDYADLLKLPSNTMGHESEAGQKLFQNLAKIAGETNSILITGSQLNRSSWDSDVKTISSVEGSYRKINICSFVGTINSNKEERNQGFFRIYLDKCRNSFGFKDNMLYMKYDLHSMKMHCDSDLELSNHKSLLGDKSANSQDLNIKKENHKQNMIDAINASLE